ncbi:MAG: GTPase HflX [Planctomycetota bacterium]
MARLFGNTGGLKPSQLKDLERIATRRTDRERVIGVDLARELGERSYELGRSIGVLLDRAGHVARVLVGDPFGVNLPGDLGPPPQPGRLSGLRLVRTELHASRQLGDADRQHVLRHRLDACARLLLDELGEVLWVEEARIDPSRFDGDAAADRVVTVMSRRRLTALAPEWLKEVEALEEELGRKALGLSATGTGERALLVGVHQGGQEEAALRMDELVELARAALYEVGGVTFQKREKPDPRTLIGSGKVDELTRLCVAYDCRLVILDQELSGVQARNLEDRLGLPVLDRTELILRIFERRARTRASRLRVELARLRYQLPRLVMRDHGLSRIGRRATGGSGTRGKGEVRLELDRRRMRERIRRVEHLLEVKARQDATRRKRRLESGTPIVSLVGYTNAGKSSWLNALTEAEVLSEDLAFATLDTTVRRTRLPAGTEVLLADTVGFCRELPDGLLDAFRSTLVEVVQSELLVHVVDVASEDNEEREAIVEETLAELGAGAVPRLTLYNKADLVDREAWGPIAELRGGRLVSVRDAGDRVAVRALLEQHLTELAEERRHARRAGEPVPPWERDGG